MHSNVVRIIQKVASTPTFGLCLSTQKKNHAIYALKPLGGGAGAGEGGRGRKRGAGKTKTITKKKKR